MPRSGERRGRIAGQQTETVARVEIADVDARCARDRDSRSGTESAAHRVETAARQTRCRARLDRALRPSRCARRRSRELRIDRSATAQTGSCRQVPMCRRRRRRRRQPRLPLLGSRHRRSSVCRSQKSRCGASRATRTASMRRRFRVAARARSTAANAPKARSFRPCRRVRRTRDNGRLATACRRTRCSPRAAMAAITIPIARRRRAWGAGHARSAMSAMRIAHAAAPAATHAKRAGRRDGGDGAATCAVIGGASGSLAVGSTLRSTASVRTVPMKR